MSKIVVDKCADEKDAVWIRIPKDSAFYHFLMEGEFDNADKKLYRERMRGGIRGVNRRCQEKA